MAAMSILRSIQQLEPLRDDWNALAASTGHALLRHEWVYSAARTLYPPEQLAIVVRRDGQRLTAAAPLARRQSVGAERLELVGTSVLHEPAGFLTVSAAAEGELVSEILGLRRALVLQRIIATGQPSTLAVAGKTAGVVVSKPGPPSLVVPLPNERVNLLETLPGKLRYDVKRARTRAADHGEVRVEISSPSGGEIEEALRQFMEVEAAGWKGRRGSAMQSQPALRAFFECYARLASEAGILRMFFLRIGSAIRAAQIAVEVYGHLWVLKIGYDEQMARCSPGFLLTAEAIGYAAMQGLRGYEFLGAPEAWERRWRPETRDTTLIVFYPHNLSGYAAVAMDAADVGWRRLQALWPAQRS
jgi:CelD/BcsL family acetyltransferase involved in cellulose biosynthesis